MQHARGRSAALAVLVQDDSELKPPSPPPDKGGDGTPGAADSPPPPAGKPRADEGAASSGGGATAGSGDAGLQLPREVIKEIREKVFSFDSFFVTATENYEADGVLFKGNLRGVRISLPVSAAAAARAHDAPKACDVFGSRRRLRR